MIEATSGSMQASSSRGVLIGDEMGLGKSAQALAVCQALQAKQVLIICTSTIRENWKREIEKVLGRTDVDILLGTKPRAVRQPFAIIGYDVLHAWVGMLSANVLIFDEVHLVKSWKARRTKAAVELSDKIRRLNGIVLGLSGTPVLNRPQELGAILRVLGLLEPMGGIDRLTEISQNRKKMVVFNNELRKIGYVRRKKIDVLKELPEKRWVKLIVDGDSKLMKEYREAEQDIVRFIAKRTQELKAMKGVSVAGQIKASWEAALRAESSQYLVAITNLRKMALMAKRDAAQNWIEEFKQNGKKLVVFGWHRQPLIDLSQDFMCSLVIGGLSDQEKQEAIDDFQDIDGNWLIACSLKAGGVGITLTQASDVLFIEQGWNPADMDQAVDRCHRIGQKDSVTGWVLICAETIDEDIADLIEQKRKTIMSVIDGVSAENETTSVLGDLVVRLAKRYDQLHNETI